MSLLTSCNSANNTPGNYYWNGSGGGGGSVNSVTAGTGIAVSGTATDPIVNTALNAGTNITLATQPNGSVTVSATGAVSPYQSILASTQDNYANIFWDGQLITSTIPDPTLGQPYVPIRFDTTTTPTFTALTLPPSISDAILTNNYSFLDVWGTIGLAGATTVSSLFNYLIDLYCCGNEATGALGSKRPMVISLPPQVQPPTTGSQGNTYSFKFTLAIGSDQFPVQPGVPQTISFYIQHQCLTSGYTVAVGGGSSFTQTCISYLLHN